MKLCGLVRGAWVSARVSAQAGMSGKAYVKARVREGGKGRARARTGAEIKAGMSA